MNLFLVGINHKTSPIELREWVSFSKRRLKEALVFLKKTSHLSSGLILSTCNRIEIYAASSSQNGREELKRFLSSYHEIHWPNQPVD